MNTQTRYFCQLKCCMVPICDPPSDAFEVLVPSAFTLGLPEILLPGPEVRRLLGYMLGGRTPTLADACELENLWFAMRDVLSLKQAEAEKEGLTKLKELMGKLLKDGAARKEQNSVISTYYKTDSFGDQYISIDDGPPLAVGVAVSKAVKNSITSSGRDVLFDPNESSFLDDMRRFLAYKKKTNKVWKKRVRRALEFIDKLYEDGAAKSGGDSGSGSGPGMTFRDDATCSGPVVYKVDPEGRFKAVPEGAVAISVNGNSIKGKSAAEAEAAVAEAGAGEVIIGYRVSNRLWALTYALALTRAAQSRSPVIVLRRCVKAGSGKAYPKYGKGQDFEMDFMERRRNLDEVFASAGCKACWPIMSTVTCLPDVINRFCFNGVKPLLKQLGKSHMLVIEHEDSVEGVANLIAALHGSVVTVKYGAVNVDPKTKNAEFKDPKTVKTVKGSSPAPTNLVPDMVKKVSALGAKQNPDVTMDNYHERNGLISMVTSSNDWGTGQAGAHVRLRMATVGRPDFVWTADMQGRGAQPLKLMPEDPNAVCPSINHKAGGCFYQCSGQVKNGSITANTPPNRLPAPAA